MDKMQVPRIGEILLKEKLIEESAIQKALEEQKSKGGMLGQILIDSNIISSEQLKKALQIQFRHKLAIAVLSFITTTVMPTSLKASESASLMLMGHVAPTSAVTISRSVSSMASAPSKNSMPNLMTSVTEQNNNQTGYSIHLEAKSMDESGHLSLANEDNGKPLPYKITYGDKDVYFSDGEALISDVQASKSNKKIETKQLLISPEMAEDMNNYFTDTLTMVIVAK